MSPGICLRVVTLPVSRLRSGESPRLDGQDEAHIARLAEVEAPLPPILVDRRTMRVIDGMHRLQAAKLKGRDTIDARFFDGSPADLFLHAVEANVTHGLPLSQADRCAAAGRIVRSHPHLSDRAIARSVGLAPGTVARIRRGAGQQADVRIGKDGIVRPLSGAEGRSRAAQVLAEHPQASVRDVARAAGISLATAHDVRKRLERGEAPAPAQPAAAGRRRAAGETGRAAVPAARPSQAIQQAPVNVLEKLVRDPSLRHNEQGRKLLRWLRHYEAGWHEQSDMIAAVPPHCAALVVQLAYQYSQMWLSFAQRLDESARILDVHSH
jgi:ParB-like chromosome segregation protein Spo0J